MGGTVAMVKTKRVCQVGDWNDGVEWAVVFFVVAVSRRYSNVQVSSRCCIVAMTSQRKNKIKKMRERKRKRTARTHDPVGGMWVATFYLSGLADVVQLPV